MGPTLSDLVSLTALLPEVKDMLDRFPAPEKLVRHIKAEQRDLLRTLLGHLSESLPQHERAAFADLEERQWQALIDSIEKDDPDGNVLSYTEINTKDLSMRGVSRYPKNADGPTVTVKIRNVLHPSGDVTLWNDDGSELPEGAKFLD